MPLRDHTWNLAFWEHSLLSFLRTPHCDPPAKCKQGVWRENIHSKQLSFLGGTSSCALGWGQRPTMSQLPGSLGVNSQCTYRKLFQTTLDSESQQPPHRCCPCAHVAHPASEPQDCFVLRHMATKGRGRPTLWSETLLRKHPWRTHCIPGPEQLQHLLGLLCLLGEQLYGAPKMCSGDRGSVKGGSGPPAERVPEKGEKVSQGQGGRCLFRARALGPGSSLCGSFSPSPQGGDEGEKEGGTNKGT